MLPWLLALGLTLSGGWTMAAEPEGARPSTAVSETNTNASAVDLRPLFAQWHLKTRKQGKRPTCSVFTLTGALEFAAARQQGKGECLSVEFLNWAANQERGGTNDGGFFSALWEGFAAHGICLEAQMPYRNKFDPTAAPTPEALAQARAARALGLRLHWIKKWDVKTGLTNDQLAAIKRTLSEGWPVCAGCRWPKAEQWVNDVLQLCPPAEVRDGHSVLLVGFRDDAAQTGGGVFIFRNSSGGRDGYMPYAYAREYVNDAAWVR